MPGRGNTPYLQLTPTVAEYYFAVLVVVSRMGVVMIDIGGPAIRAYHVPITVRG